MRPVTEPTQHPRVVIFGDSLPRPRPDLDASEATEYEDTYAYIVREKLRGIADVEISYVESLDTNDAVHWSQRMVAFRRPDIVVYHLGINDCSPRIFRKNSHSLLLRPWFRKATADVGVRALSRMRPWLTRVRPLVYTTPEVFESNLAAMVGEAREYNPEVYTVGVSIALAGPAVAERSFGIQENIARYNGILARAFDAFVDVNELVPSDRLHISDGVHLTHDAHQALAEEILGIIEVQLAEGHR